ncbi:hypothetical protein GCM10023215_27160 [Pseudonocardia yuanmonensis]|uniref:DUF3892 domain-containing protein n=1 Tax=Pseudonocardia yuanmonensis TaxID=1095914 RepID=A0ABP8WJ94_9PSEU
MTRKMRLVVHTARELHRGEWAEVADDVPAGQLEDDALSDVVRSASAGDQMWIFTMDNGRRRAIPFSAMEWIEVEVRHA